MKAKCAYPAFTCVVLETNKNVVINTLENDLTETSMTHIYNFLLIKIKQSQAHINVYTICLQYYVVYSLVIPEYSYRKYVGHSLLMLLLLLLPIFSLQRCEKERQRHKQSIKKQASKRRKRTMNVHMYIYTYICIYLKTYMDVYSYTYTCIP